ncbi:hypothetical protein [Streptomyces sp. CC77]|uniref:hypothetical protein n=1 Tax=Streptomyces sp. CC77 TaxID=1906739 RepID=UPI0011135993|nr:hypothetical protein [Streptomyces sp. CC77]
MIRKISSSLAAGAVVALAVTGCSGSAETAQPGDHGGISAPRPSPQDAAVAYYTAETAGDWDAYCELMSVPRRKLLMEVYDESDVPVPAEPTPEDCAKSMAKDRARPKGTGHTYQVVGEVSEVPESMDHPPGVGVWVMKEYTLDGERGRTLEAVLMVQDGDKWLVDNEADNPRADEPTTSRRLVAILS